jgi:hypothetical protein
MAKKEKDLKTSKSDQRKRAKWDEERAARKAWEAKQIQDKLDQGLFPVSREYITFVHNPNVPCDGDRLLFNIPFDDMPGGALKFLANHPRVCEVCNTPMIPERSGGHVIYLRKDS